MRSEVLGMRRRTTRCVAPLLVGGAKFVSPLFPVKRIGGCRPPSERCCGSPVGETLTQTSTRLLDYTIHCPRHEQ
jgi:hypothetical protein